jgi:hypothetical protein
VRNVRYLKSIIIAQWIRIASAFPGGDSQVLQKGENTAVSRSACIAIYVYIYLAYLGTRVKDLVRDTNDIPVPTRVDRGRRPRDTHAF